SGPYVDHPSTYSQTMISPNWCQVLSDSPNTPVSVLATALPLTAWLLTSPVTNGPTASTITGTAMATPVAYLRQTSGSMPRTLNDQHSRMQIRPIPRTVVKSTPATLAVQLPTLLVLTPFEFRSVKNAPPSRKPISPP